jgi:hypothetical protein
MQPFLRAFILCSPDLIDYREVVKNALLQSNVAPVMTEYFGAHAEAPAKFISRTIEAADIVIALVGFSKGAIPPDVGETRSYWQIELDLAMELEKELYLFFASENLAIPSRFIDISEDIHAIEEYRIKLSSQNRLYHKFSSRDELLQLVLRIQWTEKAVKGREKTGFKIFLSYRRKDLAALCVTSRLYERMVGEFGEGNVFLDVKNIPLGSDFRSVIITEVSRSNTLFAVVGPNWNDEIVERCDDPRDFVRLEIESALQLSIPTIPILLGDLQLPLPSKLPKSIARFADMNGFRLDVGLRFYDEIARLFKELRNWYV